MLTTEHGQLGVTGTEECRANVSTFHSYMFRLLVVSGARQHCYGMRGDHGACREAAEKLPTPKPSSQHHENATV